MKITAHQFARMLDATLTGAVATEAQTREMMALAKQHDFYSVIGPRCYIPMMMFFHTKEYYFVSVYAKNSYLDFIGLSSIL